MQGISLIVIDLQLLDGKGRGGGNLFNGEHWGKEDAHGFFAVGQFAVKKMLVSDRLGQIKFSLTANCSTAKNPRAHTEYYSRFDSPIFVKG